MHAPRDTSTLHHSRSQANCAHWYAACQRLCQAKDVGLQVIVVTGKELTCAPEARLHLINNQQSPSLATERGQARHVLLRGYMYTSFSLYQFHDDGSCLLVDSILHGCQIIVTNVLYIWHQRSKWLAIMGLPRCGQRTHGTTVKAA